MSVLETLAQAAYEAAQKAAETGVALHYQPGGGQEVLPVLDKTTIFPAMPGVRNAADGGVHQVEKSARLPQNPPNR